MCKSFTLRILTFTGIVCLVFGLNFKGFSKSTSTSSTGNWSTATWNNGIPVAGDDVTIATAGASIFDISSIASLNSLNITGGATILSLNSDLTIVGAFTLNAAAKLDINGKTLILNGTVSAAGTFKGSLTSSLTIQSNTSNPSLWFDNTTPANLADHTLLNFSIIRSVNTNNPVIINNDLIIGDVAGGGTLKVDDGQVAATGSVNIAPAVTAIITLNGSFTGNGGFAGTTATADAGSVVIGSKSAITTFPTPPSASLLNLTFNKTVAVPPATIAFSNTCFIRNILTLATDVIVTLPASLTIGTTGKGIISGAGLINGASSASTLVMGGTDPTQLNFSTATATLNGIDISKTLTTGVVTLNKDLVINSSFQLSQTNARLSLAGKTLTIGNTSNAPVITCNGQIIGSIASILKIEEFLPNNNNVQDVIRFDQSGIVADGNKLNTLSIKRYDSNTGFYRLAIIAGTTALPGSLSIENALTIVNNSVSSSINLIPAGTGSTIIINGTVTPANATNNWLFAGATNAGGITINNSSDLTVFRNSPTASVSIFNNLTFNKNVNTTFSNPAALTVMNKLEVGNGASLTLPASLIIGVNSAPVPPITSVGTIECNSLGTLISAATDLTFLSFGTGPANLRFSQTGAQNTLNSFTNNKTAGDITLKSDLVVNNNFVLANTGSSFYINGQALTLKGATITNTGKFIGSSASKLYIAGTTGSPTLNFDSQTSVANATLSTLGVNRTGATVTLSNPLYIQDLVDVTAGTLASAGNLTMLSSATNSSSIGPLNPPTSDVSGDVKVQSYVTGGSLAYRSTRCMSTPINDAALSSNKTYEQLKTYIIITGTNGGGFDAGGATQPYTPTIALYSEPAAPSPYSLSFLPLTNIQNSVAPGVGFLTFFRGNRTAGYGATGTGNKVNAPFAAPENVLLTYTGPINKGPYLISMTNSNISADTRNGFNLLGNPYPSVIDWHSINKTNIDSYIYILKPGGGTAVYDMNGSLPVNGGTRYIQPGQGFYAVANTGGGSVTFTESSKAATITMPGKLLSTPEINKVESVKKHTTTSNSSLALIRLNLEDSQNTDETVIAFEDGNSAAADYVDAPYFSGSTVTLGTLSSDGQAMVINRMPDISEISEVKLNVDASASEDVKLNFTDLSAAGNLDVFLKDAYSHTETDVKLNPVYDFAIDKAVAASYGADRFTLLFKPPVPLPVSLTSFTVKKGNNGAELNWNTVSEKNNDHFEIERSVDNKLFAKLDEVKGAGTSFVKLNYNYTDKQPVEGVNYYRLKQVDINGKPVYSKVEAVDYSLSANAEIAIYPNPAADELKISLKQPVDGNLLMTIFDVIGNKLQNTLFENTGHLTANIAALHAGMYIVEIRNTINNEIIGKAKFFKN